MFSPVFMAPSYMSEFTHFIHLFVIDVAALGTYILELLSVSIIVFTTVVAFYKLFKHAPFARVYLLHGQSVGLTFKLGAEILATVTAASMEEIFQIFLLIVIKACMVLLIEWELKGIEDPYSHNGYSMEETHSRHEKNRASSRKPFYLFINKAIAKRDDEIEQLKHQIDELQQQAQPEPETPAQKKHEEIMEEDLVKSENNPL